MIKRFPTPGAISEKWLLLTRVIVGIIVVNHGLGIFKADEMKGNIAWLRDIRFPFPTFMAYLGKSAELVSGICIFLGLFIRLACIPLIINMAVIAFIMLKGTIFGDAQLPFLLMLFCIGFFIQGGGKWSADSVFFKRKYRERKIG